MRITTLALALTLVARVGMAAPPSPPPRTPLGADTPQALLLRLNRAADLPAERGMMRETFACYDTKSRTEMAALFLMALHLVALGLEEGERKNEALAKGLAEATGRPREEVTTSQVIKDPSGRSVDSKVLGDAYRAVVERHRLTLPAPPPTIPPPPSLTEEQLMAGYRRSVADADQPALISDLLGVLEVMPTDGTPAPMGDPRMRWKPSEVTVRVEGDRATVRRGSETLDLVREQGKWLMRPEAPPPTAQ